jgi:hypothetical protein
MDPNDRLQLIGVITKLAGSSFIANETKLAVYNLFNSEIKGEINKGMYSIPTNSDGSINLTFAIDCLKIETLYKLAAILNT